jgi:hypothetical protein
MQQRRGAADDFRLPPYRAAATLSRNQELNAQICARGLATCGFAEAINKGIKARQEKKIKKRQALGGYAMIVLSRSRKIIPRMVRHTLR